MKKIIILFSFLLFHAASILQAAVKDEDINKLSNQFNSLAKRFAYQEHFFYNSKVEMCKDLAALYRKLFNSSDLKETKIRELLYRTYSLGISYSACGIQHLSYTTKQNQFEFKEWEEIEKLHKKLKNTHQQPTLSSKEYCKQAVQNKEWDHIYFLTDEHSNPRLCPEAMKLVEPHYSYAYKMRHWE